MCLSMTYKFEDIKGVIRSRNRIVKEQTIQQSIKKKEIKKKKKKRVEMFDKTLDRKMKVEQNDPNYNRKRKNNTKNNNGKSTDDITVNCVAVHVYS